MREVSFEGKKVDVFLGQGKEANDDWANESRKKERKIN